MKICRYTGNSSKSKPCPVCNQKTYIPMQPKKTKQRKFLNIPHGNFGRTGCMKKPNLCSIPEHDVVTDFTSGHRPIPHVTTKTKKINKKIVKELNKQTILGVAEVKQDGADSISVNCKINKSFTENGKEIKSASTTDEGRIKLQESIEDRFKVGAKMAFHINFMKPDSKKSCNNEMHNVQESGNFEECHRSVNAKRPYGGEGENYLQWKKPKLIPARDFLKRYFTLPPISSKIRKIETTEDLENEPKTEKETAFADKSNNKMLVTSHEISDDVSKITDDLKLINAFSRITIHKPDTDKKLL